MGIGKALAKVAMGPLLTGDMSSLKGVAGTGLLGLPAMMAAKQKKRRPVGPKGPGMAKGGLVTRGDGCAKRGKTRGKYV